MEFGVELLRRVVVSAAWSDDGEPAVERPLRRESPGLDRRCSHMSTTASLAALITRTKPVSCPRPGEATHFACVVLFALSLLLLTIFSQFVWQGRWYRVLSLICSAHDAVHSARVEIPSAQPGCGSAEERRVTRVTGVTRSQRLHCRC